MKKLIGIAIVVLILGAVGFKAYQFNHPEKFQTETDVLSNSAPTQVYPESTPAAETHPSVVVNVNRPVSPTRKGVIEVGASGFNCFVVDLDKNKNWELVSKEFGESLAYEGFATTQDVQTGLKKYLSSVFTKGVAGKNAHFVMSSGALKNEKTKLIADAIEKMGYVVNRVTPEQEGKYALRALLPKDYTDNSYVVDIGSGNTKISWYEGSKLTSIELPGAKYYQDGKTDEEVYQKIKQAVQNVPTKNRENCFIIGGVPFSLAKEIRKGEERYTLLENPDYYSAGDDVKKKSGINIYRALADGSGTKNFIFDWDANFTIGFLLTLN